MALHWRCRSCGESVAFTAGNSRWNAMAVPAAFRTAGARRGAG
jgi:hypothetical protein